MKCTRVASTRGTIYSLSGGLSTAIVVHVYIIIMYFIYSGQVNISVCLSVCSLYSMFMSLNAKKNY